MHFSLFSNRYHFRCVNLKQPPKKEESWYCYDCSKKIKKNKFKK